MLEHVNCSTPDLAEETAKKLADLLPECAGENGEIDLDKLRQCLSSKAVEGNVERYRFEWPGKRVAMAAASAATTKTLRPCREESVDYDTTENLYIEGDNLEVLKLLQTGYAGKVKMIYIDPPYNTGEDYVYRDRFSLTQKELDNQAGAFDEDGNRFEKNDSAEARYHSNWCSMMYPRLKLAKNLMRDDGVIFISISDQEVASLKKICDELFGERNFQGHVHWRRRHNQPNDKTKMIGLVAEHILVYAKDLVSYRESGVGKIELTGDFSNPDNDPRGPWASKPWKVGSDQSGSRYTIVAPNGSVLDDEWMGDEETYKAFLNEGRIYFPKKGDGFPRKKYYLSEREEEGQCATNWWHHEQFGHNQGASDELSELLGRKNVFSNPKPTKLLKRMISLANAKENTTILDFFSGSATTAHAVMALNAEDGGHRKFIMVQLPEVINPATATTAEARKTAQTAIEFLDSIAKPHTICEIGKERIRRVGKKILDEHPEAAGKLDTGFRVLKLDSSSLVDAGKTVGDTKQGELALSRIREDRSPEDLLFQVLLETRIPLSDSIKTAKVGGNEVFFVGGTGEGAPLVACLDPKARMDSQFFIEVAKLKPGLAFFRDDAFADDSARTNLQQVFNQFSPNTAIRVI